jgi:hypothetical protein
MGALAQLDWFGEGEEERPKTGARRSPVRVLHRCLACESRQLALWVAYGRIVRPWCRPARMCEVPDCIEAAERAGLCSGHRKRAQRGQSLGAPVVKRPVSSLQRLHEAAIARADALSAEEGVAAAEDVLRKALTAFAESAEAAGVAPVGPGTLVAARAAAEAYAEAETDGAWTRADKRLQGVAVAYGRTTTSRRDGR